jgi:hypothetical protein
MELDNLPPGKLRPEIFDGNVYTLYKRADGIIQVLFKPGCSVESADIERVFEIVQKIKSPGKFLLLAVFGEGSMVSAETRELMASEKIGGFIAASALVATGMALELLLKGYIRINQPASPVKLFRSAETAVQWLQRVSR